jgi:hypothetical protein
MENSRMRSLLLVALLFAADEPPENIAAYLKQRDEQAAAEIKRLDSEIRRLSGDKSKSGRELLGKWRKERDALKKDASDFVPEIPYDRLMFKVGEIGRLSGGRAHPHATIKVAQIIDAENMLVDVTWIYDDLSGVKKYSRRLWLRGFPTDKLANDIVTTIDEAVEVKGNQAYETVAGAAETVFVIEPFDMRQAEPYLKSARPKPPKKR